MERLTQDQEPLQIQAYELVSLVHASSPDRKEIFLELDHYLASTSSPETGEAFLSCAPLGES